MKEKDNIKNDGEPHWRIIFDNRVVQRVNVVTMLNTFGAIVYNDVMPADFQNLGVYLEVWEDTSLHYVIEISLTKNSESIEQKKQEANSTV